MIKNIHIENFRAYKSFNCEFKDGINLVIGDNGAGKTSLLMAIAHYLSGLFNGNVHGLRINPSDPYTEVTKAGDATYSRKENYPMIISGVLELESKVVNEYTLTANNLNVWSRTGNIDPLLNLINSNAAVWPLISYQRFDREWRLGKDTTGNMTVDTKLNDRRDGYVNCLSGQGQEANIQKWCLKMSILEFEKKKSISEFDTFKRIVKTFLQAIEDIDDDYEVGYSVEFAGLTLKYGDEIKPLYELSTGYKSLLSMIMELAYRVVLLNPAVSNIEEQTGIVIIDEIDAHLHPKWQWRVIGALEKGFPKVQFIVATHSPIIISSAKNAHLINLGVSGQVSYSDGAYGYSVDDVLNLKQGSDAIPGVSKAFMDRLEAALDADDLGAADRVIAEAEAEFGKESPAYKELADFLEINRWVEAS